MATLPVFDEHQAAQAKHLLATQISLMMGRKYEENDWADVYETVKEIPRSSWSNLSIDVMHGNLGVEHKMLCRPSDRPILTECGLDLMHPAGTRAIRIPDIEDATAAARHILGQYRALIARRAAIVKVLHGFSHGQMRRGEALDYLVRELGFGRQSAEKLVPATPVPFGAADSRPDMRFGWLLWKSSLDEFLYFEEEMIAPDPARYRAEWRASGGGRRLASRNLWVYDEVTGRKVYSITTSAGAKIQPYFRYPRRTIRTCTISWCKAKRSGAGSGRSGSSRPRQKGFVAGLPSLPRKISMHSSQGSICPTGRLQKRTCLRPRRRYPC
jgi:hypothetical protein